MMSRRSFVLAAAAMSAGEYGSVGTAWGRRVHRTSALQDWSRQSATTRAGLVSLLGGDPAADPKPPYGGPLNFSPVTAKDNLGSCTRQLYQFVGPDGADDIVQAYLMIPTRPRHGVPAILCLHQTQNSYDQGFKEPVGLAGTLAYALELAERGFVTLTPNWGGYPPTMSDPFDYADNGYNSPSGTPRRQLRAVRLLRRAIDMLDSLPRTPGSIGVIGHSAGGLAGICISNFDHRIKAMASSCGVTPWYLYAAAHNPHDLSAFHSWFPDMPTNPESMPFPFEAMLETLAPRPLWFNAPLRDYIDPGNLAKFRRAAVYLAGFEMGGNLVRQCISDTAATYKRVFHSSAVVINVPNGPHTFAVADRRRAYAFLSAHL